jgi:hypothetical protein
MLGVFERFSSTLAALQLHPRNKEVLALGTPNIPAGVDLALFSTSPA